MSSSAEPILVPAFEYDGASADDLARRLDVPRIEMFSSVGSTLDVAHRLADAGAPNGTLIVADRQTAGRGRQGRSWRSDPAAGVWLTTIERPRDVAALGVLSLRIGLCVAPALDALAVERVRLKWPNDLYLSAGKLAGVLVEARWRDGALEWVAVGVGINVKVPSGTPAAAGLPADTSRIDVLSAVVPAVREAARAVGSLSGDEVASFARRDLAAGRDCLRPVAGKVIGIDSDGSLLVSVGRRVTAVRAGSLVLREVS